MIFFENLQKYKKEIVHGVSEREDGSVNPFSGPESWENILRLLRNLGYQDVKADNLIFAEQVHGSKVHFCSLSSGGDIKPGVDGLISDSPGQVLVVKTADCLPILIYDPHQGRVGALHAGREGLIKGIVERGIGAFNSTSSLIVGVAPHIRNCCYFLRGESRIYASDPKWRKYTQEREGQLYFDLTQIALDKLLEGGVKKENIEDCGICTSCLAERFFSFRKREGRVSHQENKRGLSFGSFIGLRKR